MIFFIQLLRFIRWGVGCSGLSLYTMSHFRIDSLLIGCLASWIYKYKPELLKQRCYKLFYAFFIPTCLSWLFLDRTHPLMIFFGYSLIPFVTSFWLLYNINKPKVLHKYISIPVRGLGKISYSLYLWHLPTQYFTLYTLSLAMKYNEMEYSVIYIFSSIFVSSIMYILVEKPSFWIRDRTHALLTMSHSSILTK